MKTNTKIKFKFAIMLLIAAFVGAAANILLTFNMDAFTGGVGVLADILLENTIILFIIGIIPLIIAGFFIQMAKSKIRNVQDLSDEDFESANKFLSIALSISSVMIPWGFVCFGLAVVHNVYAVKASFLWDFLLLIVLVVWIYVIQYQAVELTKKIFPEKRGNILETKFQKEWYSSCDEAEKQIIGEACYRSYKTMNTVYPILFAVLICICTIFELSPFYFVMAGLLWGIQLLSYYVPSYKLEHGKK